MPAFSCPYHSICCRSTARPFAFVRRRTAGLSRPIASPLLRFRSHRPSGIRNTWLCIARRHPAHAPGRQPLKRQRPTEELPTPTDPFDDSFHPSQGIVSEGIPERECGIAAVKICRLNRRKSKWVRVSHLGKPIIIPSPLVAESAINIDRNRRVRSLIVEIERARRRQWIQKNRVAADKATAIANHRRHPLRWFPHHGGVGEMIGTAVSGKRPQAGSSP